MKQEKEAPTASVTPAEIETLLKDVQKGDTIAAARLLPIVYRELRHLAAHYMHGEKPGQTIQPTELVHEAYLRLLGNERLHWQGVSHFKAMAATSMRRILVERARKKLAEKHGGGEACIQMNESLTFGPERSQDFIALDGALLRLANLSPRQSRIVEMRFFGGLTVEEIAEIEKVSARTVKQDWSIARSWLHHEMAQNK